MRLKPLSLVVVGISSVLSVALSAAGCNANCLNDGEAAVLNVLQSGMYAACQAKLGPLCGSAPDPVRADSSGCAASEEGPGSDVEAFNPAPADSACASATASPGETDCQACVRAFCCAENVACFHDWSCACWEARETPGVTVPEGTDCGAKDAAYDDVTGCMAKSCAAECQAK